MAFNSPFTPYLDTNYVPQSHEIPEIKAILEVHQTALRDLLSDAEVYEGEPLSESENVSFSINEAIRSHREFIRLHSALLSPARDLPLDILANIFASSLDVYEEMRGSMVVKKVNPRHPIVTLTHVCHEWRELAVGIPSLWRHVHIDSIPRPRRSGHPINQIRQSLAFNRSVELIIERVATFLSRAAPLPIALSCDAADPHSLEDSRFWWAITPLVNLLRTAKWQDVSYRINIQTPTSPFRGLLPLPLASVETIRSLKVRGFQTEVFHAHSLPLQHLQVLDLDCSGSELLKTPFHSDRLTHLSIGPTRKGSNDYNSSALTPDQALEFLKGFPSLQECELRLSASDSRQPHLDRPSHSVALPSLRSLSLGNTAPPASFGSRLIVPSLRQLSAVYSYETMEESPPTSDGALMQLVQEYGSHLTAVTFSYGHLTKTALTSCLEHLANVTSLTLVPAQADSDYDPAFLVSSDHWLPESSFFDRQLLNRLTREPESHGAILTEMCLCPNMERLAYEIGPEDDTLDAWIDLIVARRSDLRDGKVAYLQEVSLSIPARLEWDSDELLDRLEERGIDVEGVELITIM